MVSIELDRYRSGPATRTEEMKLKNDVQKRRGKIKQEKRGKKRETNFPSFPGPRRLTDFLS